MKRLFVLMALCCLNLTGCGGCGNNYATKQEVSAVLDAAIQGDQNTAANLNNQLADVVDILDDHGQRITKLEKDGPGSSGSGSHGNLITHQDLMNYVTRLQIETLTFDMQNKVLVELKNKLYCGGHYCSTAGNGGITINGIPGMGQQQGNANAGGQYVPQFQFPQPSQNGALWKQNMLQFLTQHEERLKKLLQQRAAQNQSPQQQQPTPANPQPATPPAPAVPPPNPSGQAGQGTI